LQKAGSLKKFELEILERSKNVLNILNASPPSPSPSIAKCAFCDVRQLCEAYWKIKVSHDFTREGVKSNLVDAEVTLAEQRDPLSWNVAVDAGPYLKSGINTLLRIPPTHYLAHSAIKGDRLRVFGCVDLF
jgi:hypothetical protein